MSTPTPDPLQGYRQPLVTATGILLGFILNFMASWVKADSELSDLIAWIVAISLIVGIVGLIIVLYRALRRDYPIDRADAWHRTTLYLFVVSVAVAFAGVFIDTFLAFLS